jgi:hypothetical protein
MKKKGKKSAGERNRQTQTFGEVSVEFGERSGNDEKPQSARELFFFSISEEAKKKKFRTSESAMIYSAK